MRPAPRFGLLALAYLLYWTLGLPWYFDLGVALVALPFLARCGTSKCAALLGSMVIALAAAETGVRTLMPGVTPYYREHEKWQHDFSRYERNVVDTIDMPYGDLIAMAPSLAPLLAEPRTVEFRTDAAGMRNSADYHGQELILVGDSFVVGNGTTQAQALPEILLREHGLDTYSIAFPCGPKGYFLGSRAFLAGHPDARFLFFYFEGNDFESPAAPTATVQEPNRYDRFRGRIRKLLYPTLRYPIAFFGMSRRLQRRLLEAGEEQPALVTVHEIGGRSVGFFTEYIRMAQSAEVSFPARAAPIVLARTVCVFFIPTKYRVYKEWIGDGAALPEPSPALETLRSIHEPRGIAVVDLTPVLRERARELLTSGETVFWRDDTHWNQLGIRAAAEVIARSARGAR